MGLPDHLQCFYNVNFKQDLSNKIVKKNDNNLLNIKRYLKKNDLLNNKNLIKRKDIYYFIFYLQKDKNITFSLNTKDFLLSNILKYKILLKLKEEIKKMDFEEEYLKTKHIMIIFATFGKVFLYYIKEILFVGILMVMDILLKITE